MKPIFRQLLLTAVFLFSAIISFSQGLYFIKTTNNQHLENLLENPALSIHYFRSDFVIATAAFTPKEEHILLDENAWKSEARYYLVFVDADSVADYLSRKSSAVKLLYKDSDLIVVSVASADEIFTPYKNDGMVRLQATQASLPKTASLSQKNISQPDPFINQLIGQVNPLNLTSHVQHLENYGTRNAYNAQSVVAQNWITQQFENLGLQVEVMDFSMPGGAASDNVIATLTGTKYPNEYIICGAHYDSYSNSSSAPGADDNASGTAAVIEMARIMKNYTFDRTVVFCAFSGEEYGLYGSAAYAARAAQQGMEIHGYVNLDMIGYLKPSSTVMKTTLIYPPTAQELATFYTNICNTYLPDFVVSPGSLSGGDSDHTSFNNNGYMGIFPFEAVPDYSPFIHTANDKVGPSYNNAAQAAVFTKAALATIATMANRLNPPKGLKAIPGNGWVELSWSALPDAAMFHIYRNGSLLTSITQNSFFDLEVVNGTNYQYYITAVYADSGNESPPSATVSATPMVPISLPLLINFETGAPYWEFTNGWGLTTTQSYSPSHSISESPQGQYQNNVTSYAYLSPVNLNLGYSAAEVSFWTRFDLETNYDYMYFEASTNGTQWTQLAQFNGTQNNWQKKTYSLTNYLGQNALFLRFKFKSDHLITRDGMYIDDFHINTTGGYLAQQHVFRPGWNSFSGNIVPVQTGIAEVFASIGDKLLAVQSHQGAFIPSLGVNTIGNWNPQSGYKVKVSSPVALTIAGPTQGPLQIQLQSGWNLIPVPVNCAVNPQELITATSSNITLIKEVAGGKAYWPAENIYTLEQLMPGKAYYAKSQQNIQLTYPQCKTSESPTTTRLTNELVPPTPNSHLILLPPGAMDMLQAGDLLHFITPDNYVAGRLEIETTSTAALAVVFGQDSISPTIEGFRPGQPITIKVERNGNIIDSYSDFDVQYPDQSTYNHEGLSRLNFISLQLTTSEQYEFVKLHPNPVKQSLSVQLLKNTPMNVMLVNASGQIIYRATAAINIEIDMRGQSAGIYTLYLQHKDGFFVRKIVKL